MRYIVSISRSNNINLLKIVNDIPYCLTFGEEENQVEWHMLPEIIFNRYMTGDYANTIASQQEIDSIWIPKVLPGIEESRQDHEAILEEVNNMSDEELAELNREFGVAKLP